MFSDPALMAYYPQVRAQALIANYVDPPNARPNAIAVASKGYQNALRFHRMLVEAGGRVLIGTDGGNFSLPGLGVHHEIQVFSEDMKLPAMKILQAATIWPAETMHVDKEVGTVEVAKLADLLIVDEDPCRYRQPSEDCLRRVRRESTTQRISTVVLESFRWRRADHHSRVDDLDWAVMLRGQRGGARGAGGRGGGVVVRNPPSKRLTRAGAITPIRTFRRPWLRKAAQRYKSRSTVLAISRARWFTSTAFRFRPDSSMPMSFRRKSTKVCSARRGAMHSS
jgi:hypothetical protein